MSDRPSFADRMLALFRSAYRWGQDEEIVPDVPMVARDPTRGIDPMAPRRRRSRHLSDEEIPGFWHGVEELGLKRRFDTLTSEKPLKEYLRSVLDNLLAKQEWTFRELLVASGGSEEYQNQHDNHHEARPAQQDWSDARPTAPGLQGSLGVLLLQKL